MEPAIHEIDPNGDTLLTLRKPDRPFAVDSSFQIWHRALPQYWTNEMHQSERHLQASAWVRSSTSNSKPDIKMRLSSKHLTLASAYFQKMLLNGWMEANSNDGYPYNIFAEEWDSQALLILLNIIHGQTQKVPQKVNLEMLAKIAVLVDYYKCNKAIEFFAKTWISHLGGPLPSIYGRDLLLRFLTSIVFGEADTFRALTKTIIYQSRGQIHSLGLPIPKNVIDAIDTKRGKLISDIISSLHDLKAKFYKDNIECSFECYSLSLGALMKGMNTLGLLDPPLKPPFRGYSVISLETALREIKAPRYDQAPQHHVSAGFGGGWGSNADFGGNYGRLNNQTCSLTTKITSIIDSQLKILDGLRLADLVTRE